MEQNRLEIFCFFLGFVTLLQLLYSFNNRFEGNAIKSELHERMSNMEANNRQQDQEMSTLKANAFEDTIEISKLRGRVIARLEASKCANFPTENVVERQERPARLLPARILYKEKNETEEEMKRFYGPPTNCEELRKLGYTLNGYYLIKDIDQSNTSRIQTVYCQFKQPPMPKIGTKLETAIGLVAVKSTFVQFFVDRNGDYGDYSKSIKIIFKNKGLNDGNGFDWDNQWFLAPNPGTYFFSISGASGSKFNANPTLIHVRINLNVFFQITCPRNTLFAGFSHQFSMKLNFSDKVDLFVADGEIHSIAFTGWLLDENLDDI